MMISVSQLYAIPNKIISQRLYQKSSLSCRFRYMKSELVVEGCLCRASSIWKLKPWPWICWWSANQEKHKSRGCWESDIHTEHISGLCFYAELILLNDHLTLESIRFQFWFHFSQKECSSSVLTCSLMWMKAWWGKCKNFFQSARMIQTHTLM